MDDDEATCVECGHLVTDHVEGGCDHNWPDQCYCTAEPQPYDPSDD